VAEIHLYTMQEKISTFREGVAKMHYIHSNELSAHLLHNLASPQKRLTLITKQ